MLSRNVRSFMAYLLQISPYDLVKNRGWNFGNLYVVRFIQFKAHFPTSRSCWQWVEIRNYSMAYRLRISTHDGTVKSGVEIFTYLKVVYCMGIQLHSRQHFFERWRHQSVAPARSQLRGSGYLRVTSEVFGSPLHRFGSPSPPPSPTPKL